jgi:hypothetical protein
MNNPKTSKKFGLTQTRGKRYNNKLMYSRHRWRVWIAKHTFLSCYLTIDIRDQILLKFISLPFYNQEEALKQISAPFPPIPAIKHWNPQDSSSAITLSTIVPDSTDTYSQGNI